MQLRLTITSWVLGHSPRSTIQYPTKPINSSHKITANMASIGEKIKEVFTGHSETHDKSDVKTPDVNAPGAYPTDKNTAHKETGLLSKSDKATSGHKHSDSGVGIEKHGHGHGHHDPEVEAKQATSAAGNYPVCVAESLSPLFVVSI